MAKALVNLLSAIAGFLGALKGVGDVLVLVGFSILLVMGLAASGIVVVRAIKALARMEPKQFVVFLLALGVGLIVLGSVISM